MDRFDDKEAVLGKPKALFICGYLFTVGDQTEARIREWLADPRFQ